MTFVIDHIVGGPNKDESDQILNRMCKISKLSHPTVNLLKFVFLTDVVFQMYYLFHK